MLLVHLLLCFARVWFCPFSLPFGVGCWLRFVIVKLPGPFCYFLCFHCDASVGLGDVVRAEFFCLLCMFRVASGPETVRVLWAPVAFRVGSGLCFLF